MSNGLSVGTLSGRIELEDHITSAIGVVIHRIDDLDERFGGLGKHVAETAAGFFTAEAALKGLEKGMDFVIDVAKDLKQGLMFGADVEQNFERLAEASGHVASTLLNEMGDATHHTIENFDLMKRINTDLAAGLNLTDEQFKVLAKGAYALAQATGTDVKTAFDTMSDAMLTGRTRSLAVLTGKIDLAAAEDEYARKLDVSTDKLSADGKMHAAREAILRSVGAATERLGEQTEGFDEAVGQAGVVYENFMDDLGKMISVSPVVMAGITGIKDELIAAFGGKQEDLIKNIVHSIEGAAISVLEWAQTIVDGVAIAGRYYNSLLIVLDSVGQGFRAITYVTEEVVLAVAKLANLLTLNIGGKSWIADLEKDMERLATEMGNGEKRLDGYQAAQQDWADTTGKINTAIEGVRQRMIAAQEAQDKQTESAKDLTHATDGVTTSTNAMNFAQDRAGDVLAQTSEEAKKQREALKELASMGHSYADAIKGINENTLAAIKTYLDAGASQGALAAAYNLTAAQIKAVADEMKLHQKILDDQSGRWADYNKMVAEMSGNTTAILKADIEKWKDGVVKSHKEAKTDTEDFYDWVTKTEKAMYAKSDQARLEADAHSKAYFDKIARQAEDAYQFALRHADQFTSGYIADLAKTADAARNAAANWKESMGGALDDITKKVRTLSGEMITVEEKAARQAMGGTLTITPTGNGGATSGDPLVDSFLKQGYSLAQAAALAQAQLYHYNVNQNQAPFLGGKGPRVPGFKDGGVGDFGPGTLAVLHGKEAIVPLDGHAGGLGGMTNVFYVNGTAEESAKKIGDILLKQSKRGRQYGAA